MDGNVDKLPFISVVVISKDRHDLVLKAVDSLLNVDYPRERYEIVVVEEGDAPASISNVEYVFLPRRNMGLGYARNTGVKHAKGDIIAFTDDDCIVDVEWLKKIAETFMDSEVAGMAGSTFAQESGLVGISEDILGFPGGGHKRYHKSGGRNIRTNLLSGCNCAYRRDVFAEFGFKEDGYGRLGADDCLMGVNVAKKRKCSYVPSAIVYHKPRGSLRKIISWFSRRRINELLFKEGVEGRKNYVFLLKMHRLMLLRVILLFSVAIIFKGIGFLLVLASVLAWYVFIMVRSFRVALYFKRRAVLFVVPLVKLCMDLGSMQGEWKYLTQRHETLGLALNEYRR